MQCNFHEDKHGQDKKSNPPCENLKEEEREEEKSG